ncbi:MAG: hypothetical protein ACRCYY_15660 [Trueperaceae bacterium]
MKKAFLAVPWLLVLLNACTPLGETTIEIKNIFGLDEKDLTIKFSRENDTTAATFSGSFTDLPFRELQTDVDIPEFYEGFTPLKLTENLGLQTIMEARSKAGSLEQFPETFVFSAAKLNLTFVDADETPTLTKDYTREGDLTMTFTKDECNVQDDNSIFCEYSTNYSEALINIEVFDADARVLFNDILTGGSNDESNLVSGEFSLTFAGDSFPPSDTEAVLKMRSSDGEILF